MKQKLGLVCALIHRPKVILLDEPTTGVDPVSRRDFWRILYELVAEGVAILTSTAYLDEAERCHRVALMHQGKLLFCNTPANLKAHFGKDVLRLRRPSRARVRTALEHAQGISSLVLTGDGVHVVVDDAARRIPEFASLLSRPAVAFDAIQQVTPSIEDLFVDAVRRRVRIMTERIPRRIPSSIENLVKRFGDFMAVDHISLQVAQGRGLRLSWSQWRRQIHHHSHVVRLAASPAQAARRLPDIDVAREPEAVRQNIGYMSQKFSLYNDLRVIENLRLFAGLYSVPQTICRNASTGRSIWPTSGPAKISSPARCPAAGSSASRSAARCCTGRPSCFSTSRPPASIRSRAVSSGT